MKDAFGQIGLDISALVILLLIKPVNIAYTNQKPGSSSRMVGSSIKRIRN
jgi:hypothetical protein